MTATVIAVTVALLAGMAAVVRIISEQSARMRAEQQSLLLEARARDLEAAVHRARLHEQQWLAVLAHEMRSPISAILGYGELLADGALGETGPRAADAVGRMTKAAESVLHLIEGIEDLADVGPAGQNDFETVSAHELLTAAVAALRSDADARGTTITVEPTDLQLVTRRADVARALLLSLSAAVKVSAGQPLTLRAAGDANTTLLVVAGTRLHQLRDDPDRSGNTQQTNLTGAGFRIALARSAIASAGGSITLSPGDDGVEIRLRIPHRSLPPEAGPAGSAPHDPLAGAEHHP